MADTEDSSPGRKTGKISTEGIRLGGYTLLRHLGRGGMAEVDLARADGPAGVEKLVVIKRILPEFSSVPAYIRMFLDEARIATTLQHPNIIQVHDVGEIGGQPYIAMEFLRGKDLRDVLIAATTAKRHLPLDFAVGTICCVCEGLHYAHEMRTWEGEPLCIIHRDLSPDNIFITFEGHVKLMDFGLAKAKNRDTETQVGVVKGTVGYMAPEQMLADDTDCRLDVFAAGVLLWEMVTAHRLFESKNVKEARQLLREKEIPSPLKYRPECPVALEAIIRRALHKDPDERYQSARAFHEDLERMAQEQSMWLSSLRRALVMDALFPGKRNRPMQDMTQATRPPTPAEIPNMPPMTQPQAWTDPQNLWLDWVHRYPKAVLAIIGGLLMMVVGLGVGWMASDGRSDDDEVIEETEAYEDPGEPASTDPAHSAKVKANKLKGDPNKRPKSKRPARPPATKRP